MKSINTFNTRAEIDINGKKYIYFDLNILAEFFNFNLTSIPNSIKILLENLIRSEDGESVTHEMISSMCENIGSNQATFEIAFSPTRVLMQDFLPKFAVMTCFTTVNEPLLDVCNNALSLESYLCS